VVVVQGAVAVAGGKGGEWLACVGENEEE